MAGLFQIFGISFPFWVLMGCLRFIFETLHALRETDHAYSLLQLLIAAMCGVAVSMALFFLFFLGIGAPDDLITASGLTTYAIAAMIIWIACVGLGSYLSTRIYIHHPYRVAGIVGFGTIATGLTLLLLADLTIAFTNQAQLWAAVWALATMFAALLAGHIARALNALERERNTVQKAVAASARVNPNDVGILVAAHNEELTLRATVESLLEITSAKHIHVVSDGSTDETVKIAKSLGCFVEDIQPNRGKARALTYVLEKHSLYDKYKAIMIMDADLKVAPDYFSQMLPAFDDPDTAAAVSRAVPHWPRHAVPRSNMFITAYRVQLWLMLQFCIRYGQTWRHMNVTPIIPGGSSIYRTKVLRKIDIDAPGLVIEDFNMTFEVHHKRLGRIEYRWSAKVIDQEPYSVRDFIKQITRWYLGFWQTVRRHGPWFSFFWATMALFSVEMVASSIAFVLFPVYVALSIVNRLDPTSPFAGLMATEMTVFSIFFALFAFEYVISVVIAIIDRKPLLIFYGLFFIPLRYIEAFVFLSTIPRAFFTNSNGMWKSPKRIAYSEKAA
jgi:cellulose synthase/poly-beta-1,6-N-acetylglucosamine synthase-like glycosyltransferase